MNSFGEFLLKMKEMYLRISNYLCTMKHLKSKSANTIQKWPNRAVIINGTCIPICKVLNLMGYSKSQMVMTPLKRSNQIDVTICESSY